MAFEIKDGTLIRCRIKDNESYTVPDGVTRVENRAFGLRGSDIRHAQIIVGDSVIKIEKRPFKQDSKIFLCKGDIKIPIRWTSDCEKICNLLLVKKDPRASFTQFHKFEPFYRLPIGIFMFLALPEDDFFNGYIKRNIEEAMTLLIGANNAEGISRLLEMGIVDEGDIDVFIECAIENVQRGGSIEVQAVLMNYKNKLVRGKFSEIEEL